MMIFNKKLLCMVLFTIFILCTSSVGAANVNNIINDSNTNDTFGVNNSGEYVYNDHNDDLTDSEYVNPNDYYFDENGNRVSYTSDTRCFNNVTMSNGYNAYSIKDGGYIETNDSKTYPIFWNDSFRPVDANDTEVVKGHWYYTNGTPIGEYLKIMFYSYYDPIMNYHNDVVPTSIIVQSMVWEFYNSLYDYDGLSSIPKAVVDKYNSGFRVNNNGAVQWTNKTHYRVFDFLGFENTNRSRGDLWGFKVTEFDVPEPSNNTTNTTNNTDVTNDTGNNTDISNNTSTNNTNSLVINPDDTEDSVSVIELNDNGSNDSNVTAVNLKDTGNPLYVLIVVLGILGIVPFSRFRK